MRYRQSHIDRRWPGYLRAEAMLQMQERGFIEMEDGYPVELFSEDVFPPVLLTE